MDAFDPVPPEWTQASTHAYEFCCPKCKASCMDSQRVWINRRSPAIDQDYRKKWQEFYLCQCGAAWWAWSSDRPPSELAQRDRPINDNYL